MSKKHLSTIFGGIAASLFAILPFCSVSAWGPERTTYTNESPADHAVFNSITNNAAIGDERNFVRVREIGAEGNYEDEVKVTPGKEYEVYIAYHNNAATETNATGIGVATDVKVASAYPTNLHAGERGMISGIITWSYVTQEDPNTAQDGTVWDEAYLTTDAESVVLRYKTGSAIIHNGGAANGSILSQKLFTEGGIPIGFNKLEGVLRGCAEYSGHITYTLVAEKTDTYLQKQISTDGENWSENVTAKPGEYVTYKVQFKNTGNTTLNNVIFTDTHDDGLTLRVGSVKVYDVNNVEGKQIDDILDISGYNVGDVAPGALVQLVYQARVIEGEESCGKTLKNKIIVKYNIDGTIEDDANVTVECDTGTDCTATPDAPECKIPETGPVEIVMAIVVVLGICGGGYYLYRTRKTLKTTEASVKGQDEEKKPEQTDQKDQPETPAEQ